MFFFFGANSYPIFNGWFQAVANYEQAADYYKGEESNRWDPERSLFITDHLILFLYHSQPVSCIGIRRKPQAIFGLFFCCWFFRVLQVSLSRVHNIRNVHHKIKI